MATLIISGLAMALSSKQGETRGGDEEENAREDALDRAAGEAIALLDEHKPAEARAVLRSAQSR